MESGLRHFPCAVYDTVQRHSLNTARAQNTCVASWSIFKHCYCVRKGVLACLANLLALTTSDHDTARVKRRPLGKRLNMCLYAGAEQEVEPLGAAIAVKAAVLPRDHADPEALWVSIRPWLASVIVALLCMCAPLRCSPATCMSESACDSPHSCLSANSAAQGVPPLDQRPQIATRQQHYLLSCMERNSACRCRRDT